MSQTSCSNCGWSPGSGLWPSHGKVAVKWIQKFVILGEGDFFGQPFKLRLDQKRFLFRWYEYCENCGQWRYNKSLRMAATGDGKTTFVAAIVVLEFAGPPEIVVQSPNIPIAAASFEQADLLFKAVSIMCGGQDKEIHESPLCGFFDVYDTEIKIAGDSTGAKGKIFRVAAVAGTNEGGLPSLFVCDEVHEWGDLGSNKARVHTVIGKSANKRKTPHGSGRILNISTAGFDKDKSMLGKMYEHAKRVMRDQTLDPRLLVDIYEAPEGLDFSRAADREIAVRAASPGADIMWSVHDRVAEWDDPTVEHHEWIRYYANTWPDITEESWLSEHPTAWSYCVGDTYVPDKADIKVAVDMALRRDSVAVVYGWQHESGHIVVRSKIWRPADGKIDHLEVINYIKLELASKFTIEEVTYDPRFFEVPARMLEDEGFNMVEFGQSVDRMTPACGEARGAILSGVIVHDNDPDFNSHVLSAVARPNERGFTLSKGKSKRHIDAAVALVILLWRFLAPDPDEGGEVWAFYG